MIDGVTNPVQAAPQTVARTETPTGRQAAAADERFDRADEVELSSAAREQMKEGESAEIRTKLVECVRAEIAAGTYLTDAKLDAAIERMRAEEFNAG